MKNEIGPGAGDSEDVPRARVTPVAEDLRACGRVDGRADGLRQNVRRIPPMTPGTMGVDTDDLVEGASRRCYERSQSDSGS